MLPLLLLACTEATVEDDPGCDATDAVGWSEASHAKGTADYDRVFALDRVQRLDLTVCASDFATMAADLEALMGDSEGGPPPDGGPPEDGAPPEFDMAEPVFVPATLTYDGRTWPAAGLRFKGNSSLMSSFQAGIAKLPLRLDLDQYEDTVPSTDDQRFYGFQKLSLGPAYSDASFLHEVLTSTIMEEAGLPVARAAPWEVWIDVGEGPVYWGLYTITEDPENAAFLDRTFGDDDGNLYQPESGCADWTCFDEADFAKQTNADAADWSDVLAALDALGADRVDPEVWRAGLEATFDVDGFLRWLALSTTIGNWDSYGLMSHNYFLYAVDGRLTWIPWDHNMALDEGMQPLLSIGLDDVGDEWPLIRTLLDDEVYSARYDALLAEQQAALDIDTFAARAEALHTLLAPSVEAETAPYTQLQDLDDFDASVGTLVDWLESRNALVTEHL